MSTLVLPAGFVFASAREDIPDGWLECDGRLLNRIEYADLFAAIGEIHGAGDLETTFNLPDYRGRVLRGVDGSAGRDPDKASRTPSSSGGNSGNNVGSVQDDADKIHTHVQNSHNHTQDPHSHRTILYDENAGGIYITPNPNLQTNTARFNNTFSEMGGGIEATTAVNQATTAVNQSTGTSTETRMKNSSVKWVIKW